MAQGGWWGLGTMGVALPYALLDGGAHRGVLVAVSSFGVLMSIGMALAALRSEAIMRHRRAVMFAYTTAHIAVTAMLAAADGGVGSPMALGFFGTFTFTAYTMPLGLLPVFGGLNLAAYLSVLADAGSPRPGMWWVELAGLLATAVACAQQHHRLASQRRQLLALSRLDPLTGALNRRGFEERLALALGAPLRAGESIGVLMLDLDDFKDLNDRLGHAAGDARLVTTTAILRTELGADVDIGRLGGDEFAAVLRSRVAAEVVDRLENALTASIGVAFSDERTVDAESLQAAADRELYRRKSIRKAGDRLIAGVAAR